jgi:hypothetical protein
LEVKQEDAIQTENSVLENPTRANDFELSKIPKEDPNIDNDDEPLVGTTLARTALTDG